jgi:hypothetical protein
MSVCDNQDDFNKSFYKAIKYSNKKTNKKIMTPLLIYVIVHTLFLFWGVLLAFKQDPSVRVVHITLAIIFSPAYVLAYYLNQF